MSGSQNGNDKSLTLILALIVVGFFLLYVKRSGGLTSVKEAVSVLNGDSSRSSD